MERLLILNASSVQEALLVDEATHTQTRLSAANAYKRRTVVAACDAEAALKSRGETEARSRDLTRLNLCIAIAWRAKGKTAEEKLLVEQDFFPHCETRLRSFLISATLASAE